MRLRDSHVGRNPSRRDNELGSKFRIRPCGCYYVVGFIVIVDSREIMDELEDGPTIADTFYEEILMGPGLRKLSIYCG